MTALARLPQVSVVMAVYNGEDFLPEAVNSILGQTLTDFEFIIVDDGSQDRSREIVRAFSDPRIRLLCNGENRGLSTSLNRGIAEARGAYVARMDHDDISLPRRLERQVEFLERNPRVGVCGCRVRTIGHGRAKVVQYPETDASVRSRLLFDSALPHPGVILRRSCLAKHPYPYDPEYIAAQDYALWVMLATETHMVNLDCVLLLRRQHPAQVTIRRSEQQTVARRKLQALQLRSLGIDATPEEERLHDSLHTVPAEVSLNLLRSCDVWLQRLLVANAASGFLEPSALTEECLFRWWRICDAASGLGWPAWQIFHASPLLGHASLPLGRFGRLTLKCALRWRSGSGGRLWQRIGRLSPGRFPSSQSK